MALKFHSSGDAIDPELLLQYSTFNVHNIVAVVENILVSGTTKNIENFLQVIKFIDTWILLLHDTNKLFNYAMQYSTD